VCIIQYHRHKWIAELEANAATVQEELKAALELGAALEKTGNNVWVGPANEEGTAYGPEWKTLVLQVSSQSVKCCIVMRCGGLVNHSHICIPFPGPHLGRDQHSNLPQDR